MKTTYKLEASNYSHDVVFEIDTDIFTKEVAYTTLDFFGWWYNKENDPIEEVIRKYAKRIIEISPYYFGIQDLITNFDEEGFCDIDGSMGIKLISFSINPIDEYDYNIDKL